MNNDLNPAYVLLGAVLILAVLAPIHFLKKRSKSAALAKAPPPTPAPAVASSPEPPSTPPEFKMWLTSGKVATTSTPPSLVAKHFDPRGVVSPMSSSLFGRITSFDTAPEELKPQVPFNIRFIRPMPADDGSNYVLAALHKPLLFRGKFVHFLIIGARFAGARISRGMRDFPVNIAIVKDESLVEDARLDFSKGEYVAIGFCDEIPKEEMD